MTENQEVTGLLRNLALPRFMYWKKLASPDKKATILFDTNGQKTLILSFAKLMVLN